MKQEHYPDMVEGRQPVLECLRSGQAVNQLYVAQGSNQGSIRQIIQLAREQNIVVKEVPRSVLDSMSQTHNHQGVIAYISPIQYIELDDLLALNKPPYYLVLAGIEDPHNLGSLIRSAEACGFSGVIIPKRRATAVTPVVVKASAGAAAHLPIVRVTNLTAALKQLQDAGCWIVGADMDGQVCYEQDLRGPIALVIGSEGSGLPRLIKDNCDLLVRIPLYGAIESFNAAVAGGILMYEIQRQNHTPK